MRALLPCSLIALLLATAADGQTLDLTRMRVVDLTHPFDERTLYWPTSPSRFELKELAFGETPGGYFYSSYLLCTPEHGGTHLDAPLHFAAGAAPVGDVPVAQLIGAAVVIDVTRQAGADASYRVTADDVLAHERAHGRIAPGTIVLVRTGWSRHWPDRKAYFGDDTPGDASKLRFPGYSVDAVRLLVTERRVGVLGIDTASLDYGASTDFAAHRVGAAHGVPNLENLTNLQELPPTGATIIALPMKIARGSGGPVRVIALVPTQVTEPR